MRGPAPGFTGHLVTALAGIAAATAVFLYLFIGGGGVDVKDSYRLDAVVPTVGALAPGARVTMSGARVGRVARITRHGIGTEIQLAITEAGVTPVPADSRVTIRQRTPVGENYVSIEPGRSKRTLPSGGVLPPERSDEYVDVDQILSVLNGSARDRARDVIRSLGGALDERGDRLNRIVGGGGQAISSGARLLRLIARDRREVADVVQRLGAVSADVEDSSRTVATIATKGLRSLQAVAARDDALRATLQALPGTLAQVRSTSTKLGTVTGVAAPVLSNLATAVREVRPAVGALRPAAQEGRAVVRTLSSTAPKLSGTLDRLDSLSGPLVAALPQLRSTLCNVNPMVRFMRPYTPDVIATVLGMGSASNSYDAIGHLIRLTPIVGENSLAGLPDSVSKAAHTLLRAGFLSSSMGLTWNPYPEPGQIGRDGAGRGKSVLGPAEVPATGYRFPHVMADC